MKFSLITIAATVASTWAAGDVEHASATLFLEEPGERTLLRRAANRRCGRRLESCITGAGAQDMPIQNWVTSLNDFRGDVNVDQLISILNNAQTASAERFATRLTEMSLTERISAFRIFRSTMSDLNDLTFSGDNLAQGLNSIISILQPLFTFLDSVIGAAQYLTLSLALQSTIFLLEVTDTAQDIAASAVAAAASLARFVVGTLRDATAILLFPNADTACLIASMNCGFRAMMNGVMPVLVEINVVVMGGSGMTATP